MQLSWRRTSYSLLYIFNCLLATLNLALKHVNQCGPCLKDIKQLNYIFGNRRKMHHMEQKLRLTWWGRRDLRRWFKFWNMSEISSTLRAYWDGLSTKISASSKICSWSSLLRVLSCFLKSKFNQYSKEVAH